MTIYRPARCDEPCRPCVPIIPPERPIEPPLPVGVFADYYALAPTDNAETIAAGDAVAFPRGFASDFSAISRIDNSTFNLAEAGAYLVMFQVNVSEASQLELSLNGTALAYTVTGADTANSQISGVAIVTTTQPNSSLSLINPVQSTGGVVITQNAGGTQPSSSHLTIVKLA